MAIQDKINSGLSISSWALSNYYNTPKGAAKLRKRYDEQRYADINKAESNIDESSNKLRGKAGLSDNVAQSAISAVQNYSKQLFENEKKDIAQRAASRGEDPTKYITNIFKDSAPALAKNFAEKQTEMIRNNRSTDNELKESEPVSLLDEEPEDKDPNVKTPQELNAIEVDPYAKFNAENNSSILKRYDALNANLAQNNALTAARGEDKKQPAPTTPLLPPALQRGNEKQAQIDAQKAAMEKAETGSIKLSDLGLKVKGSELKRIPEGEDIDEVNYWSSRKGLTKTTNDFFENEINNALTEKGIFKKGYKNVGNKELKAKIKEAAAKFRPEFKDNPETEILKETVFKNWFNMEYNRNLSNSIKERLLSQSNKNTFKKYMNERGWKKSLSILKDRVEDNDEKHIKAEFGISMNKAKEIVKKQNGLTLAELAALSRVAKKER